MKIRMNANRRMAGPEGSCEPGQIVEVSEARGMELVAGGYAVAVDGPAAGAAAVVAPGAAVVVDAETATGKVTKGKK